jgi:hypothetical protein
MYGDPQPDCERDQQSCRRGFNDCEKHLFHNASFSRQSMIRRDIW